MERQLSAPKFLVADWLESPPIVAVEIRVQHGDLSRRDTASPDVPEAETETFLVTPHGGSSVPFDWVPYGPR